MSQQTNPIKILRMLQVMEKIGLKRPTIYAKMKSDLTFPKPIHMGDKAIGFVESEIDEWLQKLMDAR